MSILVFLLATAFVAWAQNNTTAALTTTTTAARPLSTTTMTMLNASESTSELRQLGKEVAESSAFAAVTLVVTILFLVREYFNNLFEIAEGFPRLIGLAYLLGGWFFAILMALLALIVSPSDGVTVTRMSLLFASASLAFGPFYVFSPTRPIKLQKQTLLKRIATVARKKESRWTTFVIFCLLTALQGLVAYDLYALLTSIAVPFEQVALTVFGYVLLTLFYLVVFYTTMLGRVFQYNDLDVVEHIRKNAFVEFRRRLHLLSGKKYAYFYVALFLIAVALQLVVVGVAIKDALDDNYFVGLSITQLALFAVFALALLLLLLVSISFVLVSAFRPVPLQLGGKAHGKDVDAALAAFTREEREIIALHLSKSHFATEVPFSVFAARVSPPIRALIDKVALDLLHLNTREPTSKQVESVGTAHLRMLEGTARAVVTTSDDVEAESVDQWLAFFVQRDTQVQVDDDPDPATRRRVLFFTLAHAFLTPSTWAKLFDDVADDVEAKARADDIAPESRASGESEMREHKPRAAAAKDKEENDEELLSEGSYAADLDEEEDGDDDAPMEKSRARKKKSAASDDIDLEANLSSNRLESAESAKSDKKKSAAPPKALQMPAPRAANKHAKSKSSQGDSEPSPPPPPMGGKGAAAPSSTPSSAVSSNMASMSLEGPRRDELPSLSGGGAPSTRESFLSSPASPSADYGASPPPPMKAAVQSSARAESGPSPPPPAQSSIASPASPRPAPTMAAAQSGPSPPPPAASSIKSQLSPRAAAGPSPPPPMALSRKKQSAAAEDEAGPMPPPPMAAPMASPPPQKSSLIAPGRGGGGGGSAGPKALERKAERKAEPVDDSTAISMVLQSEIEEDDMPMAAASSAMAPMMQSSLAATTFGGLEDDVQFAELSAPTVSLPFGFDGTSAPEFTWAACAAARVTIDGEVLVATKASRIVDLPLGALAHANLVQLRAYANEDFDKPVLALWVAPDAPPMSVARSLEATIAVADVVRVILQLARALQHLHNNDVLHGALSPDTVVMVEPSDGGATVALLSDYVGGDERVPPALYAAPERTEAYQPRTREADVFSLGAVLQWALASQSASSATLQRRPGIQNLARQMTNESPQARPPLASVIATLQSLS